MTAIDWLGLWAALQVIGVVIGVVAFAVMVLGAIIYVGGGALLDWWRSR